MAERTLRTIDRLRPVAVPRVGDMVMVRAAPHLNGGAHEAPAVVTMLAGVDRDGVWLVNVRVWLNASDAAPAKTRVPLYPHREAADAAVPTPTDTHVAWLR
jgi:hypothetical protein